jgi:SAM-dependent methyltransferase
MLHPIDSVLSSASSYPDAQASYADLQKKIEISQSPPFLYAASMIGIGWIGLLVLVAAMLRLFGRGRPDHVDWALARHYHHVPEMALHKKIELKAFMGSGLCGRVADLGCGNGIIGGILLRNSAIESMYGIDLSPESEPAAASNGYSGFLAADLAKIDLPDGSFDGIISICVLEHVGNLASALREARRLLKPGGQFSFSTPSPQFHQGLVGYRLRQAFGLSASAAEFARGRDLLSMHMHYISADDWSRILQHLGFENIRIQPLFSRWQLLLYDVMNFSIYFPRVYFCDKLQTFGTRHDWFARLSVWATAVVAACASSSSVTEKTGTHWFISACASPLSPIK